MKYFLHQISLFRFKTLLRNIKFLCTRSITDVANAADIDILKYEIAAACKNLFVPQICSIKKTLDILVNTQKSLCRFGDGELGNILKIKSDFQYEKLDLLSKRLSEVLSSKQDDILIGLPKRLYETKENMLPNERAFWRSPTTKRLYTVIEQSCHPEVQYVSAEVTIPFCYTDVDAQYVFTQMRKIWQNKPICIIAGEGILEKLQHDIFDNASSVEKIVAPKKNAFSQYEEILKSALQINKDRIMICILGQTATVLAYDLARAGYRALDVGHIAKAYDVYCQKQDFDDKKFFSPD